MLHKLRLQTKQQTWERPTYKRGSRVSTETYMASTTTAFRTRVSDEFLLTLINDSRRKRFPIVDELAVYVEVKSMRRYKLPFVVKNVLDALKGYAYNDDGLICSICAEQHSRSNCEKVCVSLFVNKRIIAYKNLREYTPIISFDMNVVPSDIILPLRASPEHMIVQSPANLLALASIEKELRVGYDGPVYSSVEETSLNMYSTSSKGDIDNLALPFLMAMNGIVYPDMSCVDRILLNIHRHGNDDFTDICVVGSGC